MTEFEKSLFRIYDRSIRSLIPVAYNVRQRNSWRYFPDDYRGLFRLGLLCLGLVSFSSFILMIVLHNTFVGDGSCLTQALYEQHSIVLENPSLYIRQRKLEDSLLVVDPVEFQVNASQFSLNNHLFQDDILYIQAFQEEDDSMSTSTANEPSNTNSFIIHQDQSWEISRGKKNDIDSSVDYEFSVLPSILAMKPKLLGLHKVRVLNITLPASCISESKWVRSFIKTNIGYDDIVINQLMFSLQSNGVLRNLHTEEIWQWPASLVNKKLYLRRAQRILHHLGVFFRSCFAFLVVSSTTALLVRILISSGVVLIFPIFYGLRYLGVHNLSSRLLSVSYPWIGSQVRLLRSINARIYPLIWAHFMFVFTFYTLYEASQVAWSFWIYDRSTPIGFHLSVAGCVLLWEYYTMIYVRSSMSIRFLPNILGLYFMLFHLYFYLNPYGFFNLAVFLLWTHSIFWMGMFMLVEAKALQRGYISEENPRAFYSTLAIPMHSSSLPPLWSLFYELNTETHSIYYSQEGQQQQQQQQQQQSSPSQNPLEAVSSTNQDFINRPNVDSDDIEHHA